MGCFNHSNMAALWCFFPLCFFLAITVGVCGQSTGSLGFISIDCGIPENSTYVDGVTGITYVSDAGFADAGVNENIAQSYISNVLEKQCDSLRSFPHGTRNCYTVKPISPGTKYLIRATFMYGNYDRLNKPAVFEVHLGVNLWKTMNISDASSIYRTEVITQVTEDFVWVCLVNVGSGTPFISALELRPLKTELYPAVNESQSLVVSWRYNMGPTGNGIVRYPDDKHDRIWVSLSNAPYWAEISTNLTVQNVNQDFFEPPSKVMQTAVVPVNSTELSFYWTPDPGDIDEYFEVFYFSELLNLRGTRATRSFMMYISGNLWYPQAFTPEYLLSDSIYSVDPSIGYQQYNVSMQATSNSTLPPLLNAAELYWAMRSDYVPSDIEDVQAMTVIQALYGIKRNWMGDPCVPKAYAWDGLICSNNLSAPSRITTLNLSYSGLTGEISTSFASLSALEYLDLSHNNLTGGIPDALAKLLSLRFLDLNSNQLNGSVPSSLLAKSDSGLLKLRIEGNPNLICSNGTQCEMKPEQAPSPSQSPSSTPKPEPMTKKSYTPIVVVLVIVFVVVLLTALFIQQKLRNSKGTRIAVTSDKEDSSKPLRVNPNSSFQLENRQFTYKELRRITKNFESVLGKGGFGTVYLGYLEDGTQVAVKMLSQTSSQGTKEFIAEAQHLTRVHHRNLVSMVGYCMDGEFLALVYEYMSQGTLQDHLKDDSHSEIAMSWRQRLQNALEAAQGLEYLHKGCRPPLVHRDVKTANILLSEKLEAKIADFGLSKAFHNDVNTHVSTAVVGTPGYLDPDYYRSYQLSEKSDVYSFGIVLLELITGLCPILTTPEKEKIHIVQWVRERLAHGNIEDIIDAKLHGEYDVNSVWKAADVALRCTFESAHPRPSMTDVVLQLKESLTLESAYNQESYDSTTSNDLYTEYSETARMTSFGIEHNNVGMSMAGGPTAR